MSPLGETTSCRFCRRVTYPDSHPRADADPSGIDCNGVCAACEVEQTWLDYSRETDADPEADG